MRTASADGEARRRAAVSRLLGRVLSCWSRRRHRCVEPLPALRTSPERDRAAAVEAHLSTGLPRRSTRPSSSSNSTSRLSSARRVPIQAVGRWPRGRASAGRAGDRWQAGGARQSRRRDRGWTLHASSGPHSETSATSRSSGSRRRPSPPLHDSPRRRPVKARAQSCSDRRPARLRALRDRGRAVGDADARLRWPRRPGRSSGPSGHTRPVESNTDLWLCAMSAWRAQDSPADPRPASERRA